MITRRDFLKSSALAAAGSTTLLGLAGNAMGMSSKNRGHVVIVGGGFGGGSSFTSAGSFGAAPMTTSFRGKPAPMQPDHPEI